MPDSIRFLASIAPLQSAMTISADGGARVKIDIPESDLDAGMQLMGWRNQLLEITVRVAE